MPAQGAQTQMHVVGTELLKFNVSARHIADLCSCWLFKMLRFTVTRIGSRHKPHAVYITHSFPPCHWNLALTMGDPTALTVVSLRLKIMVVGIQFSSSASPRILFNRSLLSQCTCFFSSFFFEKK